MPLIGKRMARWLLMKLQSLKSSSLINGRPLSIFLPSYSSSAVPPSIRAVPTSGQMTARKGGSATLECKASGNPVPSIHWIKKVFNYVHLRRDYSLSAEDRAGAGATEAVAVKLLVLVTTLCCPPRLLITMDTAGNNNKHKYICLFSPSVSPERSSAVDPHRRGLHPDPGAHRETPGGHLPVHGGQRSRRTSVAGNETGYPV